MAYELFKNSLNPSQLEAVVHMDGPLLVIAGAGSGKTRTIAYRVAYLIEKGISPYNILLLTFTKRAASEMLDRASSLLNRRCKEVEGGTFHSLAYKILRQYAPLLGFRRDFSVLDRQDMEDIVHSLLDELRLKEEKVRFPKKSTISNIISKASNLQKGIDQVLDLEYPHFAHLSERLKKLTRAYEEYKRKNHLMDYDDLLKFMLKLLEEFSDIRGILSDRFRYVLVDEYQDTNRIQAKIVQYLAYSHRNIMVVGDDAQSIYSFRGADYRNMADFIRVFPDAKIIKLEQNYRSTQPILNFTNALINQSKESFTKCLYTKRSNGRFPKLIETHTEAEQAMAVCRDIRQYLSEGIPLREMAVLFRAAYHSFELEVELAKEGIPYVKYGGFKFLESAHIKDLLSYLRVVINVNDIMSWRRILNFLKQIGPVKSQKIIDWIKMDEQNIYQLDRWPEAKKGESGHLKELSNTLNKIRENMGNPQKAIKIAFSYYMQFLEQRFDDYPKRKKELEQIISMASRYNNLKSFVEDLILSPPSSTADMDPDLRKDSLVLSTVHSAKGLEWSVVFIIWAMDGYFPSTKALLNEQEYEEERRLMYVACTRARDELRIYFPSDEWPRASNSFSIHSGDTMSSFISPIPTELYEYIDLSGGKIPVSHKITVGIDGSKIWKIGDRVMHPAFGRGVISKVIDEDRIEVFFKSVGVKLLHLSYTQLQKI